MRKSICILLSMTLLMLTFSGCSTAILSKNVTTLPLVDPLSQKEVIDYYAKALSYDTIANRDLKIDQTKYETSDVDAATAAKLKTLVNNTEYLLEQNTYSYSKDNAKLLDQSTYNYIKAFLNDKKLSGANIVATKQALGFYFVDVKFNIGAGSIGTFTNKINLLGLNGALKEDSNKQTTVDTAFMSQAVSNLNKYYSSNLISKTAAFDSGTCNFTVSGNKAPALDFTQTTLKDNSSAGDEATSQVQTSRAPQIDTKEFNSVAGSSKSQSAYMPDLATVYNVPTTDGSSINGAGIYPSGSEGLSKFGFNRSQLSGNVTLRFVYKDDAINKDIIGYNVYPINFEVTSGIGVNTDNVTVPDFLMTQFKELIDRSDRAIVNDDMAALMSGYIYSDAGMAVLTGYEANYSNIQRNMSTVRRVISRDTKNNAYLIEVETTRQEGSKASNTFGTYKDKYYDVVEQSGTNFVITDSILMSRQMTNEPSITPDSAVTKRLVALNLAGEVSKDNKTSIQSLLSDLYTASTYRVLNGPQDKTISGKSVHVDNGMYDCFNSDTTMLSSTKKEYLNETLRELLVKYGTNVSATYNGTVTQWIGGTNNQAEFTTEELITYANKNTAVHLQTYYLVSCMSGKWVIDDMQILSQEDVSGDELSKISQRVGNSDK